MQRPATLTRRSVLGLAALTLAGCRLKMSATPRATTDPDAAALAAARVTESQLVAAYDAAIAAATGDTTALAAARDTHLAHLNALHGEPAQTPATFPTLTQVPDLLRSSATSLRSSALTAVDGQHAAVFASIAASHEVSAG